MNYKEKRLTKIQEKNKKRLTRYSEYVESVKDKNKLLTIKQFYKDNGYIWSCIYGGWKKDYSTTFKAPIRWYRTSEPLYGRM